MHLSLSSPIFSAAFFFTYLVQGTWGFLFNPFRFAHDEGENYLELVCGKYVPGVTLTAGIFLSCDRYSDSNIYHIKLPGQLMMYGRWGGVPELPYKEISDSRSMLLRLTSLCWRSIQRYHTGNFLKITKIA